MTRAAPRPDFVRSLARGLDVIRAFGQDRPQMTLSEVARATDLPRAAARRLLLTLAELGYVRQDSGSFSLCPRVLALGYAYLSGLSLLEVAEPHLEELVAETHESSSVAVLDGEEVVYVARVPTKRIMTVSISVGARLPAYATSLGRALLAGLAPEQLASYLAGVRLEAITRHTVTDARRLERIVAAVREQGFATCDQELEEGLRSAAVPIRGARGTVVAAVNLSTHASRVSMARLRSELLPRLQRTAGAVEADIRARRGPLEPE